MDIGYHSKSVRHMQEYGGVLFYSRYVTVFFINDEKSWVHIDQAVIWQSVENPILHAVSPVSKSVR